MNPEPPPHGVILIRHGETDRQWQGVCYGRSDVPLSPDGMAQTIRLAERLDSFAIKTVYHSGLYRTRILAELLARQSRAPIFEEPALLELDFGDWESRSWVKIYAETGNAMEGWLYDPESFRSPSGETTCELQTRVMKWYRAQRGPGRVVAVSHGGAIAAIRGASAGIPPLCWSQLVPAFGEIAFLNFFENEYE